MLTSLLICRYPPDITECEVKKKYTLEHHLLVAYYEDSKGENHIKSINNIKMQQNNQEVMSIYILT